MMSMKRELWRCNQIVVQHTVGATIQYNNPENNQKITSKLDDYCRGYME